MSRMLSPSSGKPYGLTRVRGLAVRHDHGSQCMSDTFQTEMRFLGIQSSPAFIRAP